ncbi:MAG: dehydrogenase [Saprospiraceae bacterium]|nr:dehydrogenase [Saprospiraceae bacterium]
MAKQHKSKIKFGKVKTPPKALQRLYKDLLLPRMIEERMLTLLRQGKISKWFSGIGQEAISVGALAALEQDEFVFPMHRNLGVFTSRRVPLNRLMAQWQGKVEGFTRGRDRSFHFGTLDHHIVGMISHLGPQLSMAAGVALAHQLQEEGKVSLAFTGEAATSEGEFHEALNVAAVWNLPVIFIIENNGYGLSTPVSEQYVCKTLADRGIGYGMKSLTIDGNNVVEVYETVAKWAKRIRKKPQPILIECLTFRMRGHEESSGTKYVPKSLMEQWAKKDPLENFERYLLDLGVLSKKKIAALRAKLSSKIRSAEETAFALPPVESTAKSEVQSVYPALPEPTWSEPAEPGDRTIRYIDAVSEALDQAMEADPKLVLMGQDIGEYGGFFKATEGLLSKYGRARVRNTPLCESAIIGVGLGLSLHGHRAMVEMQFADFVSCGFNQIVNNLAKLHYRWGHSPQVVIRLPCGGGVSAGPFHSQTMEAWFAHTPGLRIVYPSNAYDAKGLLLTALQCGQPVLYFEHKMLYRSNQCVVPAQPYGVPLGKGKIVQTGASASIITFGAGVEWALAETMDMDVEIVDLRSLQPLDHDLIRESVTKTGKALVLHEASLTGGFGGELAAWIGEHLFEALDAPVIRVASLDTPIPFARPLEEIYQAKSRLADQLAMLLEY